MPADPEKSARTADVTAAVRAQLDFLTHALPPSRLQTIWVLLTANIVVIALLGALMIVMSSETAYFVLAMAIMGCAITAVLAGGVTTWRLLARHAQQEALVQGLNQIESGFVLTDVSGSVLYYNAFVYDLWQQLPTNWTTFLDQQVTHPPSHKSLQALRKELSSLEEVTKQLIFQDPESGQPQLWSFTARQFGVPAKQVWRLEKCPSEAGTSTQHAAFLEIFKSYQHIFQSAPMGLALLDATGQVVAVNAYFRQRICAAPGLVPETCLYDFLDQEKSENVPEILNKLIKGELFTLPIEMFFKDAPAKSVSAFATPAGEAGALRGLILHFFDSSSQRDLHIQIVQAQKTQAMGQLAGGIAHDFNNLLTAIIGFCDLLLARHSPSDQSFTDIMQIKQNSNRAANLVRQLLAYSKQQTLQPKVQSVVEILSDLTTLLERLVGINVVLGIHYGHKTGLIRADRGQFEQVIINLVVNARDAMSHHGTLSIKTYNKVIARRLELGHDAVPEGKYVVIEVIDTGCGISQKDLGRIFDPFFSTKAVGQGTGLGLSTVYGIIKQTDGHILVESSEGAGTTFQLLLPLHTAGPEESVVEAAPKAKVLENLSGQGHILLVEDEDAVRLFAARALQDKGYRVTQARDGFEALELLQKEPTDRVPFDLLLSDVVMPGMDGPTLVTQAHALFPDLKVIFISGYAEDAFRQRVQGDQHIHFLAKPFSLKILSQKVKEVLQAQPS